MQKSREEIKATFLAHMWQERLASPSMVALNMGIRPSTARGWWLEERHAKGKNPPVFKPEGTVGTCNSIGRTETALEPVTRTTVAFESVTHGSQLGKPKILIYDIETLPNRGFFFDIFSDRGIPLQFVESAKSVCTISWKWLGDAEAQGLVAAPYDDKMILRQFMPVWEQADYTVGHYGDGFDMPFLAARLAANGLPSLPPVTTVDTYKLAKRHFGKALNSNKLDHLGEIFGVGKKNKTDASLWVRCANGDPQAIAEMLAYNKQDVDLLEQVFIKLLPYVRSKINCNLHIDDIVVRCKQCGSENLSHKGYEYTPATVRERKHCNDCGSWSMNRAKVAL